MKNVTKLAVVLACSATISIASNAMALDGGALYADPMKGGCSACHGKDAKTPIMPTYPKLAGQSAEYAYNQIKDIESGARSNGMTAAMKGVLHMTTDEEKKAISEWLSTQ